MSEESVKNLTVKWLTSRIEFGSTDDEMERFFFKASDDNTYYIDLRPSNRSSELVAITLIRDAFLHNKKLNIYFEKRNNRRWVKAINLWG